MKISIVMATYNSAKTVERATKSLYGQTFANFEHFVIDGGSSDSTIKILEGIIDERSIISVENDEGIYDALNKGMKLTSGDVVGLLHSDDQFMDELVLERVSESFMDPVVQAVYGDLVYVDHVGKIKRFWKPGHFEPKKLAKGWMPPHPTLFVRKSILEKVGRFDQRYTISSDYDFVVRLFRSLDQCAFQYIPTVLVKMQKGGASNRNLKNITVKMIEDYRIMSAYFSSPLHGLLSKNISKIPQIFSKNFHG